MFAIIMAFVGPIVGAAGSVIDAHISNHIFRRLSTILFYNNITNLIGIPFLLLFGTPHLFDLHLLPALLAVSAINIGYQIPYYKALKSIDTSVISGLMALGKVIIPVMAYFLLEEKLNIWQYIGFFFIILFSLVLNRKRTKKLKINRAFYYMLFVSIIISIQLVLFKYILNYLDWISTSFYTIIFSNLWLGMFFFQKRARRDIYHRWPKYRAKIHYFLINESLDQAGNISAKYALSELSVVVTTGIASTQPIFALIFCIVLHHLFKKQVKENICKKSILKKVFCFTMIILGTVLTVWD